MISQLGSQSIKRLSGSHHPWVSEHHTDNSNPTPSIGVDRGKSGTFKTTVFWRLTRLEKRLDLGSATRNATPHSAMHRASMGATDGQRNFADMRKPLGKPWLLSGEDRKRTFRCFRMFVKSSKDPTFVG